MWNREQRRGLVVVTAFLGALVVALVVLFVVADPLHNDPVEARAARPPLPLMNIRGRILDAVSGQPLSEPSIQVLDPMGWADPWLDPASPEQQPGEFQLGGIPLGRALHLRIGCENYETIERPLRVESTDQAALGDLRLRPLRRVSGTVLDDRGDRASGAWVVLEVRTRENSLQESNDAAVVARQRCDARGNFDFGRSIPADCYRIRARAEGAATAQAIALDLWYCDDMRDLQFELVHNLAGTDQDDESAKNLPPNLPWLGRDWSLQTSGQERAAPPPHRLLLHDSEGRPLAGALAWVSRDSQHSLRHASDTNGLVALPWHRGATVTAVHRDCARQTAAIPLGEAPNPAQAATLEAPTLRLTPGSTLLVQVHDEHGAPLVGAGLRLGTELRHVDRDGIVRFPSQPLGPLPALHMNYRGLLLTPNPAGQFEQAGGRLHWEVVAYQPRTLSLQLAPETAPEEGSQPWLPTSERECSISFESPYQRVPPQTARSSDSGLVLFEALPPGPWLIRIQDADGQRRRLRLEEQENFTLHVPELALDEKEGHK